MFLLNFLLFRVPFGFINSGETQWFDQRLDHYDYFENRTFKQRFYVNSDYALDKNSTKAMSLLFYIGGEIPLYSASLFDLVPTILAQRTNSILIGLEHRFFGESVPTEDLSIDNLNYLTIEQSLADLANFIQQMKYEYCISSNNCSVGVIGGSYPGALSAWFKLRFPHIADASWASSAPVYIHNNFTEYDMHCAETIKNISEECYYSTKETFDYMEELIVDTPSRRNETMKLFGITNYTIDDVSFLYMIADVLASSVQFRDSYKHLQGMCTNFTIQKEKDQRLNILATAISQILVTQSQSIWDSYPLEPTDPSINATTKDLRAWTWMTCNEVGWFQTSSSELRSKYINLDYFEGVCKQLFNTSLPDEDMMNRRLGGKQPLGTSTVFVNGERDPWIRMSITESNPDLDRYAYVVKDGQHCDDLRWPTESDVEELATVRETIMNEMSNWIRYATDEICKNHGTRILNFCICPESQTGEFCEESVHSQDSFTVITIMSLVLPTFFLLVIGGIVWAFGQNTDSDLGTKPAFYT